MRFKVKNWSEYQQYKDRKPTWLKFHRDILNDRQFMTMSMVSRAILPLMWLLASESDDGTISDDIEEITFRLRVNAKDAKHALKECQERGFLIPDGDVRERTETYKKVPREETETETEGEKDTRTRRVVFSPPDWIDPEAWKRFEKHRKAIRKPMTDDARNLAVRKLDEYRQDGHEPTTVIDNTILNGWTGLFPPKESASKAEDDYLDRLIAGEVH